MEKKQSDLCLEILRRFHKTSILDEDRTTPCIYRAWRYYGPKRQIGFRVDYEKRKTAQSLISKTLFKSE